MSHHDHKGPKRPKPGHEGEMAYRLMRHIMQAERRHSDPKHVEDHEGWQLADRAYLLTLIAECVRATAPQPLPLPAKPPLPKLPR